MQQVTTLGLICAAFAWALYALGRGHPWTAAFGAIFILFGYLLFLGLEFGLMQWANLRDPYPAAKLGEIFGAWLAEAVWAPLVFCWRQPFRSGAFADRLDGRPGQRGLVLVHGFVCNRGLWNRWYPELIERGIPFVGVNLEPVFGEIDAYAVQIDAAVAALTKSTGLAPVVVAHSMGGLAARAWLRHGGPTALNRVHHIITLGSPHGGTALARFGFTDNARQMMPAGAWLDGLAVCTSPEQAGKFTCLFSNCDNIVFPASTAILPGSPSLHVPACAHVQMVDHPLAVAEVMRWLEGSA